MPVLIMSAEEEQVLLVLIYQLPVANQPEITCFIKELTAQFEELHIDEYYTVVLGDFDLDQIHNPYIDLFNNILTRFAFTQPSNYSTHIVFHGRKQTPVEWLPSPYSDHFVLLIDIC